MEPLRLQIFFIIGILLFLGLIVFFLKKKSLTLKYTLLWIMFTLIMLVVVVFPDVLNSIRNLLGFEVTSNAIFSLLFGFIITIMLSLTSIISRQSDKIKTLIQSLALAEKRIRDLEDKM